MTIEAMKLALEELEGCYVTFYEDEDIAEAITALRQAIEQAQKQEPVAWRWLSSKTWRQWSLSDDKKLVAEAVEWLGEEKVQPLYTSPPQRQWVGLTDEERAQCVKVTVESGDAVQLMMAIEAKLKQKNTFPPQRQPLTDEQIVAKAMHLSGLGTHPDVIQFARAIEAAHGIKGEA